MPRKTLSQEIGQTIHAHSDFGPMKINMYTVDDWRKRVLRMEQTITDLRRKLRAAGKEVCDEDECGGPGDEYDGREHGDHP